MPFRYHSPGILFFALATAALLSLFGRRSGKRRKKASPEECGPYVSDMQRVVASYADYTAEVFDIFVKGRKKVDIFSRLTPGCPVDLKIIDGKTAVVYDDIAMAYPILPESSRLPELLENGHLIEAFLGGRDVLNSSCEAEFCSIIVFYKLDGVPPTTVNVK